MLAVCWYCISFLNFIFMVYFAPPPRHPPCSLCLVILLIYCFMLLVSSLLFYFCWLAVIDLLHLFLIVPCCVAFHTLVSSIFKALVCVFSLLCCTASYLLPCVSSLAVRFLLFCSQESLFDFCFDFFQPNKWLVSCCLNAASVSCTLGALSSHSTTWRNNTTRQWTQQIQCAVIWGVFTSSCWALCTMVFCACVCAELGKIVHFCQPKFFRVIT